MSSLTSSLQLWNERNAQPRKTNDKQEDKEREWDGNGKYRKTRSKKEKLETSL
jgi:hypothetical protein